MNNDIIGKNIRKYRELKGYSQEYMAHELDLTQASYAKLESNSTKISVERLFMIAKLLETDVAEILELNKQTVTLRGVFISCVVSLIKPFKKSMRR